MMPGTETRLSQSSTNQCLYKQYTIYTYTTNGSHYCGVTVDFQRIITIICNSSMVHFSAFQFWFTLTALSNLISRLHGEAVFSFHWKKNSKKPHSALRSVPISRQTS